MTARNAGQQTPRWVCPARCGHPVRCMLALAVIALQWAAMGAAATASRPLDVRAVVDSAIESRDDLSHTEAEKVRRSVLTAVSEQGLTFASDARAEIARAEILHHVRTYPTGAWWTPLQEEHSAAAIRYRLWRVANQPIFEPTDLDGLRRQVSRIAQLIRPQIVRLYPDTGEFGFDDQLTREFEKQVISSSSDPMSLNMKTPLSDEAFGDLVTRLESTLPSVTPIALSTDGHLKRGWDRMSTPDREAFIESHRPFLVTSILRSFADIEAIIADEYQAAGARRFRADIERMDDLIRQRRPEISRLVELSRQVIEERNKILAHIGQERKADPKRQDVEMLHEELLELLDDYTADEPLGKFAQMSPEPAPASLDAERSLDLPLPGHEGGIVSELAVQAPGPQPDRRMSIPTSLWWGGCAGLGFVVVAGYAWKRKGMR